MTEQGSRQWCRSAQRSSTSILRQPKANPLPVSVCASANRRKKLEKKKKIGRKKLWKKSQKSRDQSGI
jgi:hypothetical protein